MKKRTLERLDSLIFFGIIILLAASSCHRKYSPKVQTALEKAGPNREELTKVLTHFSQDPADSLKLRAAEFLIGNMPGHHYKKSPAIFDAIFDSAASINKLKEREQYFKDAMERLHKRHPGAVARDSLIKDIRQISSGFLIRNINLAFEAYYRMPEQLRPDLSAFYNYILPYRTSWEPLEFDNRSRQYAKYQWVYKRLQSGHLARRVIDGIIDSTDINFCSQTSYSGLFSGRQIMQTKFGTCEDATNYMVNIFRSVGFAASIDFTPHWGNVPNFGHSWLSVITKDSIYTLDTFNKNRVIQHHNPTSLPKVYRRTYRQREAYQPFTTDVTTLYKPSNQVGITQRWGEKQKPQNIGVSVFDKRYGWFPVAKSPKKKKKNYLFNNLGQNVVFLAGYYDNSQNFHAINYPFIVTNSQKVVYFNPNKGGVSDSTIILRKYPPHFPRRSRMRLQWINRMNTLVFQGSDSPSFTTAHNILEINAFNSTHVKTFPLSYKDKYKYYRLLGPDTTGIYLATLKINSQGRYKKTFSSSRSSIFSNDLTDDNPLTWQGGKALQVRYMFDRPTKIKEIQLQVRNDNNHINIGDTYQLMVWEKGWQPVGPSRTAQDTMLIYRDLPENALYWLRNITKGKEETVFTLTNNGRQWWPGVSGY